MLVLVIFGFKTDFFSALWIETPSETALVEVLLNSGFLYRCEEVLESMATL